MSNSFDKLSVLDSFIEEVNSYLPEIQANLERLAHTPEDMEALEETYRRAHTIGGSASMMDFPGLAHVAHGMEDILGDVMDDLAALDPPTIGLLQRSLARMHRLLGGIHSGINEDAVIAEDDADYSQYRVMMEAAAHSQDGKPAIDEQKALLDASAALSLEPAITSLDEMLASFRTPSLAEGEEISWPEEPYVDSTQDTQPQQPVKPEVAAPAQPVQPSALEMLAATAAQAEIKHELTQPEAASTRSVQHENQPSPAQVYSELQEESQVLAEQASSLKRTLTQLRLVVSIIEGQRIEFKSFLDGSKDALDRMEEWAGKAMGLNLRNSPEQVRRYLPLSVMWVANTKLKMVLGLLTQMTSSMEITEEQVQDTLQQLHSTIEACGDVFEQVQSNLSAHLTHDPGWTPW
jgi:chemotaxis protein histidine kinase CheA